MVNKNEKDKFENCKKKYEVVSNLMIVWEYHCSAKSEGMLNVKLCAFLR